MGLQWWKEQESKRTTTNTMSTCVEHEQFSTPCKTLYVVATLLVWTPEKATEKNMKNYFSQLQTIFVSYFRCKGRDKRWDRHRQIESLLTTYIHTTSVSEVAWNKYWIFHFVKALLTGNCCCLCFLPPSSSFSSPLRFHSHCYSFTHLLFIQQKIRLLNVQVRKISYTDV